MKTQQQASAAEYRLNVNMKSFATKFPDTWYINTKNYIPSASSNIDKQDFAGNT